MCGCVGGGRGSGRTLLQCVSRTISPTGPRLPARAGGVGRPAGRRSSLLLTACPAYVRADTYWLAFGIFRPPYPLPLLTRIAALPSQEWTYVAWYGRTTLRRVRQMRRALLAGMGGPDTEISNTYYRAKGDLEGAPV
jgi:hypothetical protein